MSSSAQLNSATSRDRLVVGTRGSLLARTQTQWAVGRIAAAFPSLDIHTEIITTKGDRQQGRPLPEIGGKGLFTEELERALLDGSIDLAVHSAKDLPTRLPDGLAVLAYPKREDPRDAWVAAAGSAFDDLPPDSCVGTTSLRRQAQLLMRRRDITFVQLRGNIDTRINKVHRGDCAGAVLAMAGLNRTSMAQHVTHTFEPDVMLPAPGQGALAIEGRADDKRAQAFLQNVHDDATAIAVTCERTILDVLDAGCRAPVAVYAVVKDASLDDGTSLGSENEPRASARAAPPLPLPPPLSPPLPLPLPLQEHHQIGDRHLCCDALVVYPNGQKPIRAHAEGSTNDLAQLAQQIVTDLRNQGADKIIAACCGKKGAG